MKKDYVLFMDVSSDIDKSLIEKYDIKLIPMQLTMDNEFLYSGKEEEINSFYQELEKGKIAKTSQITPFIFESIFKEYLDQDKDILYLCLSSGLSSTYDSCVITKNILQEKYNGVNVYPIDTLNASAGITVLASKMGENKLKGLSIEENYNDLEELKKHLFTGCFVQDLMHLKRGGRIGTTKAFIGSLLGIKPLIKIIPNGKLENFTNQKGELRAILKLANIYEETGKLDSTTPIVISDALNQKMANLLEKNILKVSPNREIIRCNISPIISAHLGPNSVVISYEVK